MGPIRAISRAMRYVLRFNSRGSRSEFWWVTAALIGGVALTAIADEMILPKTGDYARAYDIMTMVSVPLYICGLLLFLSVTVRRLHDIGLSAWYLIIFLMPFGTGFILMAWLCSKSGMIVTNDYGPPLDLREPEPVPDIFG